MSDNDDNEDQGRKTNADRDHKPKHEKREGYAPRGEVGRKPAGLNLGGGSAPRQVTQAADQPQPKQAKEPPQRHHDPSNDPRPVFHETGDKDIDKFYGQTHRMIPKDDVARGVTRDNSMSSTDGQTAKPEALKGDSQFIETDDPEVNAHYQKTETMISREEAEKAKAREIMAKFEADKGKDRGHDR